MESYPDYDFDAATLFEVEMEDGNSDAAAAALQVLRVHAPGLMTMARDIRFKAHYESGDAAVAALRELAAVETEETEPLEMAARSVGDSHMREHVVAVLREAVGRPTFSPIAGGLLVEQLCKLRRWQDARLFVQSKLNDGAVGRSAARALCFHFAADGQTTELTHLLRAHHESLRRDTELWGWTGYALFSLRYHKQAVEWMKDWRERGDAEPWMLVNAGEALRAVGRNDEARQVHRHALTLDSPPGPRSIHSLWLAADAALSDAWAEVEPLMQRVDAASLRPCHQFLRGLVDAMLIAHRQRPFAEVRHYLESAMAAHPSFRQEEELRLVYRRVRKRLWKMTRGFAAWWYFFNRG
jgi:hypothetical protein